MRVAVTLNSEQTRLLHSGREDGHKHRLAGIENLDCHPLSEVVILSYEVFSLAAQSGVALRGEAGRWVFGV